jgi:hypothetical protein
MGTGASRAVDKKPSRASNGKVSGVDPAGRAKVAGEAAGMGVPLTPIMILAFWLGSNLRRISVHYITVTGDEICAAKICSIPSLQISLTEDTTFQPTRSTPEFAINKNL